MRLWVISLIEAAEIDSQFMERKPEGKLYTRQNDETEYMFMLGALTQRQYVVDHHINGHFF